MTINGPAPIVPSFNVQNVHGTEAVPSTPEVAARPTTALQAPDGVNAELWQMLTPDEQSFFANQSILGPLAYGPVQETSVANAPRGQRIDVRA